jgi:hypothetical protein
MMTVTNQAVMGTDIKEGTIVTDFDEKMVVKLLSDAGGVIKKHEAIARETGSSFNVFEVANIGENEVVVCRVLTELLSPKGSHAQGGVYLELFLHDCLNQEFSKDEIKNARVSSEYSTDENRRIDIVIEIGGRFIPIEVKILGLS